MRRHSSVEPRRVIFIGVEGESERAFVPFLERCCRDEDLHLSANIKLTRGGDSVAVVEEAGRHLARRAARTEIEVFIYRVPGGKSACWGKGFGAPCR